eukprot:scaffold48695_cov24-Phaeocystis_antarctica.AAC.2
MKQSSDWICRLRRREIEIEVPRVCSTTEIGFSIESCHFGVHMLIDGCRARCLTRMPSKKAAESGALPTQAAELLQSQVPPHNNITILNEVSRNTTFLLTSRHHHARARGMHDAAFADVERTFIQIRSRGTKVHATEAIHNTSQ